MLKLLALSAILACASATSLTPDNVDSAVAGKSVFIKFQAPWCGHCKSMKPAWDRLMGDFKDHASALVADVDCTAEGKPLCDASGVKGFPTIKWGSYDSLEDYEGGRDYDALKKFADENLKPQCSPSNMDLCDDDKKAEIEKLQAIPAEDLAAQIAEKEAALAKAEADYDKKVKKLQRKYEKATKKKERVLQEIKDSGLGLMKSVQAAAKKAAADADKEEL